MRIHYNIFDTLLEPVFVLNSDQKVIYCNETAAIVCGHSIRKITRGMKFSELIEFSEPLEGLKNLISVCDPTPYKELTFTTPQGGEGKVQITIQPIFDQMGDKSWIVFVRDVTLEERLQKKYRAELEQKEDVIKDLEEAKLQLENYSKNLEKMVAERTRELSELNQTMTALLDSLHQGFFIFNKDGQILNVSSKACEQTIECRPEGQLIWDVLKIGESKTEGFKKWMLTVFMEMLPFEDLAPLGPTSFPHSDGKSIALEYFPLRSSEGSMDGVVVVASDITSLVEAQQQALRERESAKLIINLVQSKNEISRFAREAQSMLKDLKSELKKPADRSDTDLLFRSLHTLKGGAALFSIADMANHCHEAETLLASFKNSHAEAAHKALSTECKHIETTFNQFFDKAIEVLGPNALSEERHIEVSVSKLHRLSEEASRMPDAKSAVQVVLSDLVMEPVESFFNPYNEVSLRLAERQEKMLNPVQIKNGKIPVLPEVYSSLFATFIHAFRNAVDHGIETPALREQAGKPHAGEIVVSFEVANDKLKISVKDDGQGVNIEKVRQKLTSRGVSCDTESDSQILQHLFDSQFSTKDIITETSGRGVGMDAIKIAAEQLGGKAWISSELGKGTLLTVEVPYITTQIATPQKKAA